MVLEPELIRLPNGVRIALDPMPGLATAAVGVWVRVGARWEGVHENGVAHLFEHMAFKGAGPRDARQFAEAIEAVGGSINAATGYERTSYYARVLGEHAAFALDLLADIVLAPHWDPAELEKEKHVVLQEMGEAFDQPDDRVFEIHQSGLFPDQPLGRPILGTPDTIAALTVSGLAGFRDAHLLADRVVICAAGAFDRAALLETAARRFETLPSRAAAAMARAAPVAGLKAESRRLEQTHLVLSWPAPPSGADAAFAARVLSEIFGGGMSSRLFQEVRERLGLVYAIDSYLESFEDVGRLGVYAGCSARHARRVAMACVDILAALAAKGPDAGELQRAKAGLAAQILMAAEAPAARAEARAAQVYLRDRLIDLAEVRARIEAVDGAQVRLAAEAALAGPAAVAAIGPKTGLGAAEAFAARFA